MNNSVLLNGIGLGNFDLGYLVIAFLILVILFVIMLFIVMDQKKEIKALKGRMKRLMSGKDAESLEDEIGNLIANVKSMKQVVDLNKKDIEVLFHHLRSTYQKTGLVKYDAFQQMGGQLSFCLVMLDQDDNGFVINSVHSTEGSYVYTKSIKKGVSDVDLGKEEAQALAQAMGTEE